MIILRGKQAQCPICDRIFTSDAMCEKHKPYATPKTKTCKSPVDIGMVERDRGWTIPVSEDAKWWGTTVKPEPAGPQTLTCANCGTVWSRPPQRGRKPRLCEVCKAKGGSDPHSTQLLGGNNHVFQADRCRAFQGSV